MSFPRLLSFSLAAWALVGGTAYSQRSPTPGNGYGTIGQPDAAEGIKALEAFRSSVVTGGFYLEFELRYMPRRGEARSTYGRLWSGAADKGQGSLLELDLPKDSREASRFLILNGSEPEVWAVDPETGAVRALTGEETFKPLAGTHFTPFLLQMPFLHWPSAEYLGLERVRSRPTHSFKLSPPDDFPAQAAGFAFVRLLLDSQFNALNEISFLDASGARLMQFAVGEITRIDERWMLRWVDHRDERTRDKTRLTVVRAAVALEFPEGVFTPAGLASPPPAVPESRIRTPGR